MSPVKRTRKYVQRLRAPVLAFLAAVLLHVALAPSLAPDCHDGGPITSHSSHNHAVCHCSCCHHGEFAAAEDFSFSAAPSGRPAIAPDAFRGRDVVFQLFRPPQSA